MFCAADTARNLEVMRRMWDGVIAGAVMICRESSSLPTRRWSEPDSNSRSRCDGQRYGVRSLKRRLDRRGMTSGAARNGLRCQLVLFRKPFHASDGPFWSGGLRRAVP